MFERFTDRARRVIVLAQEEARGLQHNYIGTEHLLLGLIREGDGVAAKTLDEKGVNLEPTRKQVVEMIGRGTASPSGTTALRMSTNTSRSAMLRRLRPGRSLACRMTR